MRIEATPRNRAGELALEIYRRTLEAIRGDRLVEAKVSLDGDKLIVDNLVLDLAGYERVFVCGTGKASIAMGEGLENVLGDRIDGGLIVTKSGHAEPLRNIRTMEAGHPVPDAASLAAGQAMLDFAAQTNAQDLVLFVLSGGASALMEAPVDGISLEDLQTVNQQLLASGATILTMNAIRSRLSRIKVGGLARAFAAHVVCLVASDVQGNRLSVIGSGPFVSPPQEVPLDDILRSFGFDRTFPESVLRRLQERSGHEAVPLVEHRIVGDARIMGEIAIRFARELGLSPSGGPWTLSGDAREAVRLYDAKGMVPDLPSRMDPTYNCMIATGETTVVVSGAGLGGRAQEMAVVAAQKIAGHPDVAWLIAGSDGTDGPTDAAGALVDGETLARAAARGFEYEKTLADNDSYHFHEAAGTLVKTGPTGSNLNDIMIVVSEPSARDVAPL